MQRVGRHASSWRALVAAAGRDQIMREFGSFDRYANEGLGVDATVIQALREELLD
jgi:hypothetical protein